MKFEFYIKNQTYFGKFVHESEYNELAAKSREDVEKEAMDLAISKYGRIDRIVVSQTSTK